MADNDTAGRGGRQRERALSREVDRAVSGNGEETRFARGRTGASTPKSPRGPERANPDLTPRPGREGEGEVAYGPPTDDDPAERTGGKVERPTARKDPLAVKKPAAPNEPDEEGAESEGNPY